MKKIILSLLGFSFVLVTRAQDIPDRKSGAPMGHRKEGMHRDHMMAMKGLNLTDAQKDQFKKERENFQKQMEDLKKNDNITVKDWKSRMENLRQEHKKNVDGILTKEQKSQIEKNKIEGRAKQEEFGRKRADMMKSRLGLTDEQSAKMDKSHKELMEKMKAIRENKSLTDEKKHEAMKELMKSQRESMKSILTEEQLNKMKEGRKRGPGRGDTKPAAKSAI